MSCDVGGRPAAIDELAEVALTEDLPEHGLCAGDLGTVVLVHRDGAGYTVEFMTIGGETVAIVTLAAAAVRPLSGQEIPHARQSLPHAAA